MTEFTDAISLELNDLHHQETLATQTMLLTALHNGFYLGDLIKLATKYQTCAAQLEIRNNNYCVNYATGDGFFTRHFHADKNSALEFTQSFDTWQC